MRVIFETQKALYSILTGDTVLMTMVAGVYDYVPQGANFPYITIGDISADDNSAKGLRRYNLNIEVDIYSQQPGRKETLDLIERLKILLDGQVLSVTGFNYIFGKIVSAGTIRSADNSLTTGRVTMKVYIGDNS